MRKILLENLIIEVRKTPYPFGIEIKQYDLIREEKRWLADKGLHLHGPGRHKSMILIYPQELRARDLREKVNKKRSKKMRNKKELIKKIQNIINNEIYDLNKELKHPVYRDKKDKLNDRGWGIRIRGDLAINKMKEILNLVKEVRE